VAEMLSVVIHTVGLLPPETCFLTSSQRDDDSGSDDVICFPLLNDRNQSAADHKGSTVAGQRKRPFASAIPIVLAVVWAWNSNRRNFLVSVKKSIFNPYIRNKLFLIAEKQIGFYDAILSRKDNHI
jgi:hypothetical protein